MGFRSRHLTSDVILTLLRCNPKGMRSSVVAERLGMTPKCAQSHLLEMLAKNKVGHIGRSQNSTWYHQEHARIAQEAHEAHCEQVAIRRRDNRRAWDKKKHKNRLKAKASLIPAASYEASMELTRIIVTAGTVPPPKTTGVRSVFELAR